MTLEAILIMIVAFFSVLILNTQPLKTFHDSGPRLGARLENEIEVGNEFKTGQQHAPPRWTAPHGGPPTGQFQ